MRRWPAAGLAAAAVAAAAWLWPARVPAFGDVRAAYRPSDVRLLARDGTVLHETRVDPSRRRLAWVPLAGVSPALVRAVLDSEDRRFHEHGGVDWPAVGAALWSAARGGPPRGASTVTMQVAALVDPDLARASGARTLREKWRQVRLARAIERAWRKDEILEAYLNLVPFRGEVEGVGAAAGVLLGKAPHGVGEAEAAVLAALIRSPNASPAAVTRRARALRPGAPAADVEAAVARAADLPHGSGPRVTDAPHAAVRLVPAGSRGDVRSTLDAAVQRAATRTLRRHLLAVRDRGVSDGAVLVAEIATGDVLAYVGSSGDLSTARHVDGIRARRQAGSTLKPILYGLAFERRLLTPASLVADAPLDLPAGTGVYRPRNYDRTYHGLVSARTALAGSLNVPAVRVLDLVGEAAFAERLRDLGFEAIRRDGFHGPSLALGSADVTLLELVTAYRALARGGLASPLRLSPDEPAPPPRRVLGPEAAFLVTDILSDRESRSVTFGLESPLATRVPAAVKTGTSKDMRDNWCVGFTSRYVVGVWVGNFSGEPMRDVSGVTGAAPVWREVVGFLHRRRGGALAGPPPGVVAARAVFPNDVEPPRREWFVRGTEPAPASPGAAALGPAPRIVYPATETVVALDPDIPDDVERLVLEAEGAEGLEFVLDGGPLGAGDRPVVWAPRPGRHRLALVDRQGRVADEVAFVVRGAARE